MPSNLKIELMNGQTYLPIIFGSFPSNAINRALSSAGYIHMNASAHKNEETWGQGGGNCACPSSPMLPLQPPQTRQNTRKNASLLANPGATCQVFCWPVLFSSGSCGRLHSQTPESCKKTIIWRSENNAQATGSKVTW
jgi:hypothetical protein